ncbi:unnamed protein product [Scytosiphon promiscuus]
MTAGGRTVQDESVRREGSVVAKGRSNTIAERASKDRTWCQGSLVRLSQAKQDARNRDGAMSVGLRDYTGKIEVRRLLTRPSLPPHLGTCKDV